MYNFYIDGVQLPIAPASMSMKINNKNQTIVLMNEGEVNILKKPGLTEVDFEILLPNVQYPFAVYPDGFKPATYYLKKLEELKVSQKSFRFIVNRMRPDGSLLFDTDDDMLFSLEEYSIEEDAENGFDLNVKISLKQWRPYGTNRLDVTNKSSKKKAIVTSKKQRPIISKNTSKTHTVKQGDTLWAIAKKYLGDGSKYTQLAKLNNISNPNIIKVGQVIKLG
ncbi:LysM peptidoglycan-binding domain-containing protein [Bacillus ndiopicus]|uniref:LysM peptidoglycan-binding domain-containing protein n=1 Tax=Bacillus ndiopicus TaxID=1347368 RepID=UPI0006950ACB|nr:LysM domain-containing protein [Bacillus ndiopicus]